ncbi:MAG: zinc-binding alcohol dehydrogenase [Ilumatobacteraceae bacterium]|nr:zinc-binding alcohol dehydrogenase [Ilumatobacteraceae bacterium]
MNVIEVTAFGDASRLAVASRPEPTPAPGRVRVRVTASDINPADAGARAGAFANYLPDLRPPFVLGWDVVGTVIDGDGFAAGTRVAAMIPWFAEGGALGSLADIVSLDPAWVAEIPDRLDDPTAATVPLNAQTAAQALSIVGAAAGDTVLVTGASGAVGAFAAQLLVAAGANVIAVASVGDEPFVASLGVKEVISRTPGLDLVVAVRQIAPDGVDAVFDPGAAGAALLAAVRDGGTFVAAAGAPPDAERGIRVGRVGVEPNPTQLADLLEQVASGALVTRVAAVLPASEVADGFRRMESGRERGKIVLTFPI